MNKIRFDKEGTEAERLCAEQFKGKLTAQLEHQYKDIDLFIRAKSGDWKSCSVKDQLRGTSRGFTSVQIELEQIDTDTQESIKGCFYNNDSDYYFWRVCYDEIEQWCVIDSVELKNYIESNKNTLRKWNTGKATNIKNRSLGRKYNSAKGVELELTVMASIGSFIPVRRVLH